MDGPKESTDPRIELMDSELLVTRPNYRVICLETYITDNKKGKPYQVFCESDDLSLRNHKPVCLYENKWHTLLTSKKKKRSVVGHYLPEIHNYDTNPPTRALIQALTEPLPTEPAKRTEAKQTPSIAPTSAPLSPQSTSFARQLCLAPICEEPTT
jgi:hypothetical protein